MTTPALDDALEAAITAWLTDDPDPATQLALTHLRDRARDGDPSALAELTDAFAGPLTFGTAGLRGALGPGPGRMNRVVVARAAAGLAGYLVDQGLAGGRVIVGYDARYNSDVFAADTAEILAGAGLKPLLCHQHQPTPVVAFGIRHYGCVAGVIVTASHNPPQDNGYKVYLGDGSQIVPPADADIAAQIALASQGSVAEIVRRTDYESLGDELVQAYLARAVQLVADSPARDVTWVHTALHGVGTEVVTRAAAAAGFPAPLLVDAQAAPDPAFPTVAFPNPEEPGAIDLALARAIEVGADIAAANDPDADRCAVACHVDGSWRMLSGDELGWLLGSASLEAGVRRHVRMLGGVVHPAGRPGRRTRPAVCPDPDRLQVDRAGSRAGLRLRRGARLLHRPGRRGRQRRHHGAAAGAGPDRRAQGRRPHPRRPARRPGPRPRRVRHRTAELPGGRRLTDRRCDGRVACAAAHRTGRRGRPTGRPGPRQPRPAAHRRPAVYRRPGAGRGASVGHRTEAEVLPAGLARRRRSRDLPVARAEAAALLARLRHDLARALAL